MAFLLIDANFYFVGSLVVFAAMLMMELASYMLGFSFGGKDTDFDLDADIDVDVDTDFHVGDMFKWIGLGSIPILLFLALFFATFGIVGLVLNHLALAFMSQVFPPMISGLFAFLLTLPILNRLTRIVRSIMPRDETNAIVLTDLIGSIATIQVGTARSTLSAPAYTLDKHGVQHILMVRPSDPTIEIPEKTKVTLDRFDSGIFYVTPIV